MNSFLTFENKRFHNLWLRDNCQCESCLHPSGQRLHETWQLNPAIKTKSHEISDDGLTVIWDDESAHQSFYSREFLIDNNYDGSEREPELPMWGSDSMKTLTSHDYQQVINDDNAKCAWLADAVNFGIAKLSNVPTVPGTILKVVEEFGFVRNTNYGDLFEVISVDKPVNLAYTPIPLSLHTDNPYRNPVPTLQLLHCLVKAEVGGVSALADGFFAASILKKEHPKAFELLSTRKVKFRYASDDAILEHRGCMIEVDSQGLVEAIRVNNRSCAPLNLEFDEMQDYYAAYQLFASILQSEQCKITLTLEAGELILFDNQRVLHGREEQALGARHLQGCYSDRDGLRSTHALLKKATEV